MSKRFPVFHVPHDGDRFPAELLDSVCIPMDEFLQYHRAMRDAHVTALVPDPYRRGGHLLRFPVSRLLCDVERFIGPEEIMERYGMGYCYERAYDGKRIKTVSSRLLSETKAYYDRHHRLLDELCRRHRRVLLLDLHSYADELVPEEFLLSRQKTPDICIGADAAYTPPALVRMAEDCCHRAGYSTAVNYPYSGCLVPNSVMAGLCRTDCIAVMLEIHKRVYLDANGNLHKGSAGRLQKLIGHITAMESAAGALR